MEAKQYILIFRTNISTAESLAEIALILDRQPFISDWTIDMADVDRVLRVVSTECVPDRIIALIRDSKYECTELED